MAASEYMDICGERVRRGYYTLSRIKEFKTTKETMFGGRIIPAGSEIKFFETRDFGFLKAITPDGNVMLCKE